jgi:hypothetical protein
VVLLLKLFVLMSDRILRYRSYLELAKLLRWIQIFQIAVQDCVEPVGGFEIG